jgi:hypothetical protein
MFSAYFNNFFQTTTGLIRNRLRLCILIGSIRTAINDDVKFKSYLDLTTDDLIISYINSKLTYDNTEWIITENYPIDIVVGSYLMFDIITIFNKFNDSIANIALIARQAFNLDSTSISNLGGNVVTNTEIEKYIVSKIAGLNMTSEMSRILKHGLIEFKIKDKKTFNFIPVSGVGFIQSDSHLKIVLPFKNSSVRILNTSDKEIFITIACPNSNGDLILSQDIIKIPAKQDTYAAF